MRDVSLEDQGLAQPSKPVEAAEVAAGHLVPMEESEQAKRKTLLAQISWFNRLRLMAALGVAATTIVADSLLGLLQATAAVFVLCGLLLLVDLGYLAWFSRLSRAPLRTLGLHVHLQIAVDLVVLTLLLWESGGIGNPFVSFYLFHASIAALLLSVRAAALVAAVSLLCVAGLGFGELSGLYPPHPIRLTIVDVGRIGWLGFGAYFTALALTLVSSMYFIATVVRRLRRREAEVRRLGSQLTRSEKLASVGTLAAGVSHEINNPVAVIRNKTQILRYRIADGDSKDLLLRELETIEKHTRRIEQITKGLLTFSREAPFEFHRLDLESIIDEGADLVRIPFQEAKVPFQVEKDGHRPMVLGSSNHLLQVIVNILLNARDASPPGALVSLATRVDGARVRIVFEDHGSGIKPENLAQIFVPFFTTKDVDKGTGLGLAISHGIIERHGGTIEVESQVGQGTRFVVTLPLAIPPA